MPISLSIRIRAGLLALLAAPQSVAPPAGLTFNATLGSIRLQARPGDVYTRQFQLSIDARQHRTHFKAHFEDWWRSENGRESFYAPPGTLHHSCAAWATANPVESAVEPGDTMVVRFTIAVPREVVTGGYWCALTVDQVADPETAHAGVGVQFLASISTGIFVDVGSVTRAADITDVRIDADRAVVSMRNVGDTPVPVDGRVEFLTRDGAAPAATVTIPRGTLLPERVTTGLFDAPLPAADVLPDGRYLVRAVMDIGLDHYIGAEREIAVTREVSSGGLGR
jgi:hypothetical protein